MPDRLHGKAQADSDASGRHDAERVPDIRQQKQPGCLIRFRQRHNRWRSLRKGKCFRQFYAIFPDLPEKLRNPGFFPANLPGGPGRYGRERISRSSGYDTYAQRRG